MVSKSNVKIILGCNIVYVKHHPTFDDEGDEDAEYKEISSQLHPMILLDPSSITTIINDSKEKLRLKQEETSDTKLKGSGWALYKVKSIFVKVVTIKPARGSSYIPLPTKYKNSRTGLVNIQNDDNKCFMWCMRYHQSKQIKNDDRLSALNKINDEYV